MLLIKKIMIGIIFPSFLFAIEGAEVIAKSESAVKSSLFGPLGAGLVVIGAGIGIGLLAYSLGNAIARQPEAAKEITAAVNLPLFLLEGVAIIGLVVCILSVVG